MKIDRAELSFGREASAALIVLNSPDVVVPARTMMAPDGGEVREAARTTSQKARTQETAIKKKAFAMIRYDKRVVEHLVQKFWRFIWYPAAT